MTIFGIIWLTICFAFFVLPDIRYLTTLTILGMVLQKLVKDLYASKKQ